MLDVAVEMALPSARAIVYVEREAYAAAVLAARMESGCLAPAPVWTDISTFDGVAWRGCVDIVTAGGQIASNWKRGCASTSSGSVEAAFQHNEEPMRVEIKVLEHADYIPRYATEGSSGVDLYNSWSSSREIRIGETLLFPTGICVAIPKGYELQIRSRSGLVLNHGITVANQPGTIDSDYRGEVCVMLRNDGDQTYVVERGEKIAQAVLCPVEKIMWSRVETLGETARGDGGFGSTGKTDKEQIVHDLMATRDMMDEKIKTMFYHLLTQDEYGISLNALEDAAVRTRDLYPVIDRPVITATSEALVDVLKSPPIED